MPTLQKITPCLWFNHTAEQAATFYTSLLPDSKITRVVKSPANNPSTPAGAVLLVEFTLAGQSFLGLNGGPKFPFTEAVSFIVHCDDQPEVDRLWSALTSNGGAESQCGWCKDRFGLSWQIIPKQLQQLMTNPNPARAQAAMQAMMKMKKIVIADLQRAADSA